MTQLGRLKEIKESPTHLTTSNEHSSHNIGCMRIESANAAGHCRTHKVFTYI